MKKWIFSGNTKDTYDHDRALAEQGYIIWDMKKKDCSVGDIIYVYISKPDHRIKFRLLVEQINLKKGEYPDDKDYWKVPEKYKETFAPDKLFMRCDFLEKVEREELKCASLKEYFGNRYYSVTNNFQGPIELKEEQDIAYIEQFFDGSSGSSMTINRISQEINQSPAGDNILIYGVPGAGKSYYIKTKYNLKPGRFERVVFHPDYTYSDFIGQILPRVEDGKLEYAFTPGPFTKILREATNDSDNMYYLVIEELNRGNAPAIFGDIFQLLDRVESGESEYGIVNFDIAKVVYGEENHQIKIPSNLTILATMNTADQNVFTLDTAFQRRWRMKYIENKVQKAGHSTKVIEGSTISWGVFASTANDLILDISIDLGTSQDKRLGAYFAGENELGKEQFPEKVLKYLWDDAFKMDRHRFFKEGLRSFEDLIIAYSGCDQDPLQAVLREDVYNKMYSESSSPKDDNNSDDSKA